MNDEHGNLMLLQLTLEAAVPLWIFELQKRSWQHVEERAKRCAEIVCEKGDAILYRSKTKGRSAEAFNALAEGVACLSFALGGVKIFGLSFEAKHPHGSELAAIENWKKALADEAWESSI